MTSRWHQRCCQRAREREREIRSEKYAREWACSFSAYYISVDALHAAWLQLHAGRWRRYAGRRPRVLGRITPCTRRRRRNVHVYFNGGGYTRSVYAGCMQGVDAKYNMPKIELATCMKAACKLLQPATSCIRYVCRLHAGCMQPACSLHASLRGTGIYVTYSIAIMTYQLWMLWIEDFSRFSWFLGIQDRLRLEDIISNAYTGYIWD